MGRDVTGSLGVMRHPALALVLAATALLGASSTSAAPTPRAPDEVGTGGLIAVRADQKRVLNTGLLPATCHIAAAADGEALPDPACTPGVIATRVTQANVATTICTSGYTAQVRPPASVTDPLKRRTALVYGITPYEPARDEYDHLVPLELGGANDVRNLWVEPPTSPTQTTTANAKDDVENKLHALVCAGRMTLGEAQQRIARDWTTALPGVGAGEDVTP